MPSSRQRRRPPAPRPAFLALACMAAAAALGTSACSGIVPGSGSEATAAGPTARPTQATTAPPSPSRTGAVSENAAWAAHRSVPAGFTRLASAKLSIGVPDGYTAVSDPQRLGTTDLAATATDGSVVAARVIPIGEGQKVPDEGPAWAAAGDVARQAEAARAKDIQITDADVDGQDGWRVSWTTPERGPVPVLKHVWDLVDIDDTSFAIVSVQAEPDVFAAKKLDTVARTLVIRGVTDGTAKTTTTAAG